MPLLYSITYVSAATRSFLPGEIEEMLERCRVRNTARDVSGMLLFKGWSFVQVLEGEQATVEELFARIKSDPRHERVIRMYDGPIAERQFKDWSMAYQNLDENPVREGYSDFLNTPVKPDTFGASPSPPLKLLMLFKQTLK